MEKTPRCPDCDTALPTGAPAGFCPRCLMGSETLGRRSQSQPQRPFVPPPAEELDEVLPGVEIIELLGRGGMGAVYKGRQPRLDRMVAVKVLPRIDDPDESGAFDERFEREARTMAQLSHANIVGVYDFGETLDGRLYILMEYVEGTNLAMLIEGGEVAAQHVVKWVPQICEALEFAHQKGVVHRDIKPSNILISLDGEEVKIADFGIARLSGEDAPIERMTMNDTALGTPDYVAPEQLVGGSTVDHRADIYSLGVLVHEMLTGKVSGVGWTDPSGGRRSDPVGGEFDPIVRRALQREPGDRYQRATHMREAVEKISTRALSPRKERSRWWIGLAIPLLIVATVFLWPRSNPPAPNASGELPERIEREGSAPLMHSPRQPRLRYATRESEHPFGLAYYQDRVYGARTAPGGEVAITAFCNIQMNDPDPVGWFAPALAGYGDFLWCAYKDSRDKQHEPTPIVAGYYEDDRWGTLKLERETTHAPALQVHGGHLFLAFRAPDGRIELLRFNRPDDFSGMDTLRTPLRSDGAPALASAGGRLWLAANIADAVALCSSGSGEEWDRRVWVRVELRGQPIKMLTGTTPVIAGVGDRLYLVYVRQFGGLGYAVAETAGMEAGDLTWISLPAPNPAINSGSAQPSLAWAGGQDLALSVSDGREVVMTQLETGPLRAARGGPTGGAWAVQRYFTKAVPNDPERPVQLVNIFRSSNRPWTEEGIWSNGPPPGTKPAAAGGSDFQPFHYYLFAGRRLDLKSDDESGVYFGGLSLTVAAGSALALDAPDVRIDDLRFDGGHLEIGKRNRLLSGKIDVAAVSSIGLPSRKAGDEKIDFETVFTGSQALHVEGRSKLVLRGKSPEFSGGWHLRGSVHAHASHSLGTGSILLEEGELSSNDTVRLDGTLEIRRPGQLSLTQFWDVAAARFDGRAIAAGDYQHRDLTELGFGDLVGEGAGTLRVRGAWKDKTSAELPFDVPADAETATMNRAQKRGASLHHGDPWDPAPPPAAQPMRSGRIHVAPYHYAIVAGGMLRTEYGAVSRNYFGGLSLTIDTGGLLVDCGFDSTLVVHDLRMEGGRIVSNHSSGDPRPQRFVIDGRIDVIAPSTLGGAFEPSKLTSKPVHVRAAIEGTGLLVVDPGEKSYVAIESRENRDFVGGWEVLSGTLSGDGRNALGPGDILVKAGARLQLRRAQSGGALMVEPGGLLEFSEDCRFDSVSLGGKALPAGQHAVEGSGGRLIVGQASE